MGYGDQHLLKPGTVGSSMCGLPLTMALGMRQCPECWRKRREMQQGSAAAAAPAGSQYPTGSKLHVGCGPKRIVGWINADAKPGADAVIDLHDPKLPAATFAAIYGSHVLEHCWPQDTPRILAALRDALLPGGTLRLSVPDLRLVVANCVETQTFGGEQSALSVLFGGDYSRATAAPDLHRQAFWKERLERLLREAGFSNIREWGVGQYPEIDALRDWSTWPRDQAGRSSISLNLEADRPGTLPPVRVADDRTIVSVNADRFRLLVRMPTRSRPAQALSVLEKYREMAGAPISIEVVVDRDDSSMDGGVRRRLESLGCLVTTGDHKSKIEAVNGGQVSSWDILLLASDDMVPVAQGYARRVIDAMAQHFPLLDGALYFDDNYAGRKLCTLPILGRRLYDHFGYVYYPEYKSFFCDNEQTEVLLATNRLVYVGEKLIEHRHPANGRASVPSDGLYSANARTWHHDEALYRRRREIRRPYAPVGFDAPPVWLSICVATVPPRRALLAKLLAFLFEQVAEHPREVEIVVDSRERITIGQKRNDMNARAVGRFVAHVDDDDWVANDYVQRVVGALKADPEVDCASLCGTMSTNGQGEVPFRHSICYERWGRSPDGTFERTPEHRNAVRRDLALRVGFPDISFGEDHDFSKRLRPHLRREAPTGGAPLYFYRFVACKPEEWYFDPKKTGGSR